MNEAQQVVFDVEEVWPLFARLLDAREARVLVAGRHGAGEWLERLPDALLERLFRTGMAYGDEFIPSVREATPEEEDLGLTAIYLLATERDVTVPEIDEKDAPRAIRCLAFAALLERRRRQGYVEFERPSRVSRPGKPGVWFRLTGLGNAVGYPAVVAPTDRPITATWS